MMKEKDKPVALKNAPMEYWPYLYEMILERNPAVGKKLRSISPEKI